MSNVARYTAILDVPTNQTTILEEIPVSAGCYLIALRVQFKTNSAGLCQITASNSLASNTCDTGGVWCNLSVFDIANFNNDTTLNPNVYHRKNETVSISYVMQIIKLA